MALKDKFDTYINSGSIDGSKPDEEKNSNDPFDSYVKTGKLPERKKEEPAPIEPVKSNPRDKFTDNPYNKGTSRASKPINSDVDTGLFAQPKTANSTLDIMSPDQQSPLSKIGNIASKAIRGGLDAYGKLIEWRDEQRLKSFSYPITNPETGKKETQYKYKNVEEMNADVPLIKMANSATGRKVISEIGEQTSNIPLKVAARFKAIGDDTYEEAYSAYLKERNDPSNGAFTKFLYDLQDSGPQSALGVLLSLGVTFATKSPSAGLAISSAYYAALSADEQLQKKGRVDSPGNIVIDVVGDQVLGATLETLFKEPIKKSILKTAGKSFVTEGSTEVAQSLLKYSNDYGHAKSPAQKQAIIDEAKQYVVNGGLVNEFLVGGVSGGIIGGATDIIASKVGGGEPSMQPKKGNAPAPEKTEEELKTDVAKQVENRNFAEIRDELATIQGKFENGEQPTDEEVAKASILSDELIDFQTVAKDKAEIIRNAEGDKIAEISTVKYDDGKVGVSLDISVDDNNLNMPFSPTENFASEKEAVDHAKDVIKTWAKENELSVEGINELLDQKQEIKSNEVVKEKVKKDDSTTPEGVAKDLIRAYVERGDTIESLRLGQMGFAGDGTMVSIGGYVDGKKIGTDKIVIEKIGGKVVNKVIPLKQIFDQIKSEKTEAKSEPKPVMPSNKAKQAVAVGDTFKSRFGRVFTVGRIEDGKAYDKENDNGVNFVSVEDLKKWTRIDNASESIDNTKKYGKQENNNTRGGNRPAELPEPVSESAKGQGESGTGSDQRGESVARGERSKRTPSARERLGSRLILDNEQRAKLAAQATDIVDGEVVMKEDSDMAWPLNEEEKLELQNYETAGGREKQGAEGERLLDEYYTNPEIVSMTWKMLDGLVPKAANILEPSVGVGRFLAGAPSDAKVTAQEVNGTTARIAKIVYPSASVFNTPFEDNFMTDRGVSKEVTPTYDLVIGNPPYGAHRGKYKGMGEEAKISKYEEYFIKRSLDLTKDGGRVAFVVPSGFLRSGSTAAKEAISKMAVLEKAYRLPNSSFDTTDIGTDIVVFKKEKKANPSRTDMLEIVNDTYFANNSDNVLGTEKIKQGKFGPEKYVDGTLGEAMDKFDALFTPKEEKTGAKEEVDEISKPAVEKKLRDETVDQPIQETKVSQKNEKSIIQTPKKTEGLIKLAEKTSKDDIDIWKNTTATGEISPSYATKLLDNKPLNEFYSDEVNVYGANLINNFNYYQGDIYAKLDQLEIDKNTMSPEQYYRQKNNLEMAAPQKHTVDRMNVSPNTNFVHDTKITDPDNGQEVTLATAFERWMNDLPYESFNGSSRYEIVGYVRGESVRGSDKVRNNMIRVRRREVGDKLFSLFLKEGLSIPEQAQVESEYNKTFNSYARPKYSEVPLVGELHKDFRGKPLEVKPVQLEGVGFLTNKGIGLLAHDVGVGKTMQAILSVNEVMKRGWAKRPLIVTPPGNVYNQWKTEIQEIIPGVTIVDLDNLGARFKGDLANLTIPEGAISTISYEGFKRLGFKQETYDTLTADLKDVMQMPGEMSKRAAALAGEKVSEQVGKGIKGTSDQKFFEDLGFDHITFDEVHNANHIIKGAKMEGNKGTEFRGLTILPSELGVKTWLATQHILRNNNNRNVFLLSATPFTNHPLEYYSILSLMARERLNRLGLKNVNDFMNMFMELTYDYEYRADGSYKEKNEIKSFKNYQQFQKLLTEFIDFRDGEEAGVKRPNRISKEYTISQTQEQYDDMEKAQEYFSPKYRDQGGTLVAIGEMRKIALSPFLSRFYTGEIPDYKTFVNESPKIKMTMELIKQNRKDNPTGGQIIYSPIGVEYFPHIKDYLIKEVGYKPTEVAIIAGSVPFNKKIAIQEQFNNGDIKVIIGSDSIKEGVNLQKNTTDMFLLSMPWNFTQMRQVIGRAWRQGNAWKNIRINNIFTENSIDIFLSQKLANKEKRYESSLAFKGDNLDVGDIDFDELKFDLATNPVIKAQIEYAYKKKALEKQIGEIKADAAFYGRKIKNITDLENEYNRYADAFDKNSDDEWYKNAMERSLKRLNEEKALLTERGLDVETMMEDVAEKKAPIATLEQDLKNLETEYATKLAQAEVEKKDAIIKENNYQAPVADRQADNKTFFEKTGTPATGSRGASVGQFADGTEILTGSLDTIRPLYFPSMVGLVNDLKSSVRVNPRLRPQTRGKFQGERGISLNTDLFENGNSEQLAKTLSHEIGHLIDYLPDGYSDKGNIIGRLMSIRRFMKHTFGELINQEIKDELWELSKEWRPMPSDYTDGFMKYRKSSAELYADAISVLFNSPGLLEKKAPQFYKQFFANLENKPDVSEAYLSLQAELTDAMPVGKWREDVKRGYAQAEQKVADRQREIVEERKTALKSVPKSFRRYLRSINTPIYDIVKNIEKRGTKIPDEQNPMYLLSNRGYLPDKINNYLSEKLLPIINTLKENGISWDQLGELLQYERVLKGDRQNIANPLGLQKDFMDEVIGNDIETPAERLDEQALKTESEAKTESLKAELGDRFPILEQQAKNYRAMIKETALSLVDQGRYSEEQRDMIIANEYYVPFRPVKYADKNVVAAMHKQVGTLSAIENPAITGILKVTAMIRAREHQNVVAASINAIRLNNSADVVKADMRFVNGHMEIDTRQEKLSEIQKENLDLVTYYDKGKRVGYYVDKYIAEALHNNTVGSNHAITKTLAYVNRLPKTVYITLNLAFQIRNLSRDFKRSWRNLSSMGYTNLLDYTLQSIGALPTSLRRAFGTKFNEELDQMIKEGAIGDKAQGYIMTGDEKTRYDNIRARFAGENKANLMGKIKGLLESLTTFGESIPKIAAYRILTRNGVERRQKAFIINTYVGTPNYYEQGKLTPTTNVVSLFSNVIIQGWSADADIATSPKTRSGYWWRMAGTTILPKLLLYGALLGLFGSWLKDWAEGESEYKKANYMLIPLGKDANGKSVSITIPEDETARIIGATVWKAINLGQNDKSVTDSLRDIFSFFGGQVPGVTPMIEIPYELGRFAMTKQAPYDSFRQQSVLNPNSNEAKAGGWAAWQKVLKYEYGQLGGNIFMKLNNNTNPNKSGLEKAISTPVVGNALGSIISVSDYGKTERYNNLEDKAIQEKAQKSLKEGKVINRIADEFSKEEKPGIFLRHKYELKAVKEIMGGLPKNADEKADASSIKSRLRLAIKKNIPDTFTAQLLRVDNDTKVLLLTKYKEENNNDQFKKALKDLLAEQVISPAVYNKLK